MPNDGATHFLDRLGEPFLFLEERVVAISAGQPHIVINRLPKLVFVLEGNLQHTAPPGPTDPLGPGSVLINFEKRRNFYLPPPGRRSGSIRVLRLTLPWNFSAGRRQAKDEAQPEPDTFGPWLTQHLPPSGVLCLPDVAELMHDLRACLTAHDAERRYRANALARLILLKLLPSPRTQEEAAPGPAQLLGRIEQYLDGHLHRPLTLPEIARAVDRSEEHVARFFRKHRGTTLFDELRRLRLKRAQYLLLCSELPINRIAEQTGFATLAHFSRTFRQEIGFSPTTYRRQTGFRTLKV